MKERKIPTQSWVEKSKAEIAHEEEYLAKRIELLNDIRIKKLLYGDSEAFKVGYEAGFAQACEITHDFAELVSKMMAAQSEEVILDARIQLKKSGGIKVEEEDYIKHNAAILQMTEYESKVNTWIKENYPHLMED